MGNPHREEAAVGRGQRLYSVARGAAGAQDPLARCTFAGRWVRAARIVVRLCRLAIPIPDCSVRFYAVPPAARYPIYVYQIVLSASAVYRPLTNPQWSALKRRRAERLGLCL